MFKQEMKPLKESIRKIEALKHQALAASQPYVTSIDEISAQNTAKILESFRKYQVAEYDFKPTTGYGYNDTGREKLEKIWADIFCAEKALVRTHFVSGTHALATVLFGILRAGDELLAVTGTPYDTMQTVIGYKQKTPGSLADYGIKYNEVPMQETGIDFELVRQALKPNTKMVLIQRSRGYSMRKPLSIQEISTACTFIKALKPDCICFVDNCYGEFVEPLEPTAAGADIIAGSLIKNPGGGIAAAGGYIAGRAELVDLAAYRLTAPGIGDEVGSSQSGYRQLYQGLFLAPHTTSQALKGAVFASALFSLMGYNTVPKLTDKRSDIIQAIELGSADKMIDFCRGLQSFSPVDAHAVPEPAPMPGYTDKVIMAGGTFIQGSSIELSADGPLRPPYIIYLQGGLTFEHAMLGILVAADKLIG